MSTAKRVGRRSLFDAFRRAAKPAPANTFSLTAFYERREEEPKPAFPRVTLREGLAAVETTAVGAGEQEPPEGVS